MFSASKLRKELAPTGPTATTALTAATTILSIVVLVIIPVFIATMGPTTAIAVMVSMTLTAPKLRGMGALARTRRASDR